MSKNIYQKLMDVRVAFHKLELKKSGLNKFANFKYYELGDFLVPATKLLNEVGLCPIITFDNELAKMVLVNTENPAETITFTSPMRNLELKGANDMQSLGGVETYQTRYLYIQLLNIVESDSFDAVSGTDSNKEVGKKTNYTNDKGNSCSSDKLITDKLITDKQRQRLYAISNGIDKMVISDILAKYKFADSKHITMSKYDDICNEIEDLKNKSLGA